MKRRRLQKLTANITGKTRKETLHGREYLVAPLSLIVPGVLNGSRGAGLYPPSEVSRRPTDWNQMPMVLDHPIENGKPVSARDPVILEKVGLGYVFRAGYGDKLEAEGWFDIENVKKVDLPLLERLEKAEKIELSTGLYLKEYRVRNSNAAYNGVRYDFVAKDYRPDHLAILPYKTGACSVKDGCGVNNSSNQEPDSSGDSSMKLTPAQRKKRIGFLTANCDCWKNKGDVEILNDFDDAKIVALSDAAKSSKTTTSLLSAVRNELAINEDADLDEDTFKEALNKKVKSAAKPAKGKAPEDDDEDDDEENGNADRSGKKGKKVVVNKSRKDNDEDDNSSTPAKKTAREWLEDAPEEIQEVFNEAKGYYSEKKAEVIERLTANIKDPKKKKTKAEELRGYKLPQLKTLLDLLPEPANNSKGKKRSNSVFDEDEDDRVDYRASSGRVDNTDFDDEDDDNDDDQGDILQIPTNNYGSIGVREVDEDDEDERPMKRRKVRSA